MSNESNTRRDFLKVAGATAATVASATAAGSALAKPAAKAQPAKSTRILPRGHPASSARTTESASATSAWVDRAMPTCKPSKARAQDLNHMSVAVNEVYQNRLDGAQKGSDNPEPRRTSITAIFSTTRTSMSSGSPRRSIGIRSRPSTPSTPEKTFTLKNRWPDIWMRPWRCTKS